MNGLLVALAGYLAVQVAISIWAARRISTEADFLVAGRSLGYPLLIFTVFASWFGAESVIASAARSHSHGFALTSAEPFAYGICLMLLGVVFAAPLWRRGLTTFGDLFRERYSRGVELLAALIMVPSSIFWAAAQLRGFGQVLTTVITISTTTAIAAAAVFCIVYTIFGGLLGDAITDLVQGIVIIIGLAALAVVVVQRWGGLDQVAMVIGSTRVSLLGSEPLPTLALIEEWAIPVIGSVVAVEMVSRVIAARSPAVARSGTVLGGLLYIVVGMIPVFIGLASFGLVGGLPDDERYLPALAQAVLPVALYVMFAGALISAILSTVNTILLVSAGLISHNVLAPRLGIDTDVGKLRLVRGGIVVLGLIALLLAIGAQGIGDLVEAASAWGSAGIVVVTTFGLFGTRGGPRTAAATLLGGLAVYLAGAWGGAPYPFITSLAVSLAIYLTGMLLERPAPQVSKA